MSRKTHIACLAIGLLTQAAVVWSSLAAPKDDGLWKSGVTVAHVAGNQVHLQAIRPPLPVGEALDDEGAADDGPDNRFASSRGDTSSLVRTTAGPPSMPGAVNLLRSGIEVLCVYRL